MRGVRIAFGLLAAVFWTVVVVRFVAGDAISPTLIGAAMAIAALDGLLSALRAAVGR